MKTRVSFVLRKDNEMQQALQIFRYQEQPVRVVFIDGVPWWVAKDVCDILQIGNSRQALTRLDDDEKNTVTLHDGTPGNPHIAVINEAGLYTVILSSRKPEARVFKRWVTHEVLPTLRKTGSYVLPAQEELSERECAERHVALALKHLALVKEKERLEQEHAIMLPKARTYDLFISAANLKSLTHVAQTLGWGRNRFYAHLRQHKILKSDNTPYQSWIDAGYFEIRQVPINAVGINYSQTFVTAKGMEWLQQFSKRSLQEGVKDNRMVMRMNPRNRSSYK